MDNLNSKQRKTLAKIWKEPSVSDLDWSQVVSLIKACGGSIKEGKGSRVRFVIDGCVGKFHKPHKNGTSMDKGAVASLRDYLERCEITPN